MFDAQGRRYINAAGGLWNVTLGWKHPRLVKAMQDQLDRMAYSSLFEDTHAPAEQLADRLVALAGGEIAYAYLSTTGSTAVEAALRVARLHQRVLGRPTKQGILSFDLSYHGASWLVGSVSGLMRTELGLWEGVLPDVHEIPSPIDEASSLNALTDLLARRHDEIGCLIMEPILGSGGIVVPSTDYCHALVTICRRHDILVVADEVATGGGRCGSLFASHVVGLEPDIICLSKGLSAGYFPVGATLFSDKVMAPLRKAGIPLPFGSTQDGNPVGCVAALTTLDIVEREGLADRAAELGARTSERLRTAGLPVVQEVRGPGLMIGVALSHANGGAFSESEAADVRLQCRDEGLLVYHFDGGLSLFPPLVIDEDDADDMVEILVDVLSRQA